MIGNLLLAPLAIGIIFFFVTRSRMGEFKAGVGRTLVLAVTLLFALGLRCDRRREVPAMTAALTRAERDAPDRSRPGVVAVVRLTDAGGRPRCGERA